MKTGLGLFGAAGVDAADEALEHGGNFAGLLDHLAGVFGGFLAECFLDAFADVELGSQRAAGAFADAEEADKISFAIALRTFGNIGWDGNRGSLHLVLQAVVPEIIRANTNVHRELTPAFPNFQILKGCHGHLVSFFLKTEH